MRSSPTTIIEQCYEHCENSQLALVLPTRLATSTSREQVRHHEVVSVEQRRRARAAR
jgi:hypothetical protein